MARKKKKVVIKKKTKRNPIVKSKVLINKNKVLVNVGSGGYAPPSIISTPSYQPQGMGIQPNDIRMMMELMNQQSKAPSQIKTIGSIPHDEEIKIHQQRGGDNSQVMDFINHMNKKEKEERLANSSSASAKNDNDKKDDLNDEKDMTYIAKNKKGIEKKKCKLCNTYIERWGKHISTIQHQNNIAKYNKNN